METNYHVGVWRFPKIEGTILGGLNNKEVFWAVYWGPPLFQGWARSIRSIATADVKRTIDTNRFADSFDS